MYEELIKHSEGGRYIDDAGRLILNAETLLILKAFGALYWSVDDIAAWFGITDLKWWQGETGNPQSIISREISRGRLEERARIEWKILMAAENGTGIEEYQQLVRDKSFNLSKLDVFGGAIDTSAWHRIEEYISSGSKGRLNPKEERYLDLLVLVYSLDGHHGKRNTIKFLTAPPLGFSYEQAIRVYTEAIEMFYCNRNISRQALQAKTADQFENLYFAALKNAKTTRDYADAANILAQRAKLLRLDQPEAQRLPVEMFRKRFTIVSENPEDIGLPKVDRQLIGRQIDSLDAPETVKERVRMDVGIEDFDIIKRMQNESQEAD